MQLQENYFGGSRFPIGRREFDAAGQRNLRARAVQRVLLLQATQAAEAALTPQVRQR